MLDILEILLWPIIELLRIAFIGLEGLTNSAGVSIVLLSTAVSVMLLPLQRWGRLIENRIEGRAEAANAEVGGLKKNLKGEELFFATDEVYKRHGYHPIQLMGLGASLFVMLPVLVAALILFTKTSLLEGKPFLFIGDLSEPDGLLGPLNVLPILMCGITVVDALIRFRNERSAKLRFFLIAAVLFVLVYTLPSGLVLYWTMSNVVAFCVYSMRAHLS